MKSKTEDLADKIITPNGFVSLLPGLCLERSATSQKLDSSMSSPGKLKADIDRAAFRAGKLPVETESSLEIITGPANRLLLTKEILDFCGALPIYKTEHIKVDPSNGNGTASK
ncbi:hypothetical protein OS493_013433 [Desmophyllum pertusum]|uniref:Uncharacterized protein n=1 Tax=Desmophyllum pertusum TaxID=174260 RepID=A0A9W9YDM0_9CNID|nr:hypothetical protein OS493_013433 [Desmophyllum pertusum]